MTKPEPLPAWMRQPTHDQPLDDWAFRTVEWPTQVKGNRERYEQRLYAELILAGGELDCSATGFRVTLPNGDKSYWSSRRCALIAARDTMLRGHTKMKHHNSLRHWCAEAHMMTWANKLADEFKKTIDQDILKALSGDHGVQA